MGNNPSSSSTPPTAGNGNGNGNGNRIVREYDFFCEAFNKLKHVHILPAPENPEALEEFLVPELMGEIGDPMLIDEDSGAGILYDQETTSRPMKRKKIISQVSDEEKKNITSTRIGRMVQEPVYQVSQGSFCFGNSNEQPLLLGHAHAHALPELMSDDQEIRYPDQETTSGGSAMGLKLIDDHKLAAEDNKGMAELSSINQVVSDTNQEPDPPKFHDKILRGILQEAPIFLFQKVLDELDLDYSEDRLFILTTSGRMMGFLNDDEKVSVRSRVPVFLTEAQKAIKDHKLLLTKVGMGDVYVLRKGWWTVVAAQSLKHGDLVQGWGYRSRDNNDMFRLALNIIKSPSSPSKS